MAKPQLSVKQFAALALNQHDAPWRLSDVLKVYGKKAMPLSSAIATLSNTPVVLFISVRGSGLSNVTISAYNYITDPYGGSGSGETLGSFLTAAPSIWEKTWSPAGAEPDDLSALAGIMGPAGISIVYLDDSDTVGICGTFGQLANIPATIFPFQPERWTPGDVSFLGAGTMVDGAYAVNGAFIIPAPGVNGSTPPTAMAYVNSTPPAVPAGEVPLGILRLWLGQANTAIKPASVDAAIFAANHLQITANTIVNVIDESISKMVNTTSADGLQGMIDVLTDYVAWLDYVAVVTVSNPQASVSVSLGADFTIPEITLQPADKSQPGFTIPAFVCSTND
jgi:hypothetical protein